MHRRCVRSFGLLLTLALWSGAIACADAGSERAIRETVTRWIDAWTLAAGHARDDVAAAQARRELNGPLLARTDGAPRDTVGAPRGRPLARMYNEFVGVAIPPDRGFELLLVERSGDRAYVSVRLRYSEGAVGAAAAAGLVPFSQVTRLADLATRPPERVFTVTRVDGEWRIVAIRAARLAAARRSAR